MTPRFVPIAEHALLVEFGARLSDEAHDRVLALDAALSTAPFDGFIEAVPAFAAIMVEFDPAATTQADAVQAITALLDHPAPRREGRLHEVSVCYDPDVEPDLQAVADATGLSTDAVINAHLDGDYQVAMYGFAPGYAYLSGVAEAIRLPRKPSAKRDVPAGSVLIAGGQCLVSTLTMPTGWWIIGRSPTAILTGDEARPFLFDVGDRVRFRRIAREELR